MKKTDINDNLYIIIPAYNEEENIEKVTKEWHEVVKKIGNDSKLVIIDDGSKDDSGSICDLYGGQDERVRVIHKENSGVSDTRNLALKEAVGEYLQFLDADDWITPNATRFLVESMENNSCDMVIADFYRVIGERLSPKGKIREDGILSREDFAMEMMENPNGFTTFPQPPHTPFFPSDFLPVRREKTSFFTSQKAGWGAYIINRVFPHF